MKTFKRWLLNRDKLEEHEFPWVKANCYRVDCHVKTNDFSIANGQNFSVVSRYEIIITTDCEKQEAMLKLKYIDDLILMRVVCVETNGHVMDEYGALY
jgi:hypothetical protein